MSEIDDIKARLPVEQVIGGYVPLKKAGRIYKGLCPFHHEKSPSFTVNPERGIFKCFGCGEGGDIFDFLIKTEGLTFPEAVRILADRAGVVLAEWKPDPKFAPKPGDVGKDRILALNAYAARLWHTILTKHEKAQVARDYLERRGLTSESIERFQIGYAPLGSVTGEALRRAGFTSQEINAAGDPSKFQDRIVFPIADIMGRTIGFTGRLLETPDDPGRREQRGPKYWNTPETPVFVKSRALFALHHAKQAMQREDLALLAEGQMDVVMLHQAGFEHTVASSGTALTIEQIRLIGRFTPNIAFAYDQDHAGIEATKRGIDLVLGAELNPYVIVVPNGKDPAECIQKDPDAWKQAYAERYPFMEWLIRQSLPGDDESLTPQRKKEAAKELVPWLARIADPVEREEWLRLVAAHLQTSEENLREAMGRVRQPGAARQAPTEPETAPETRAEPSNPLTEKAELAAALMLSFPEVAAHVSISDLKLAGTSPFLEEAASRLEAGQAPGKELSLAAEAVLKSYQELELDPASALQEVATIMGRIRSDSREDKKAALAEQIRQAQILGDSAKVKELFESLKGLL